MTNPERLVPRVEPALQHLQDAMKLNSSHIALRFDLIPRSALELLAKTLTEGCKEHDPRGYIKHLGNEAYLRNRLNHMYEHLLKLVNPRKQDEEYNNTHLDCLKANIGAIMFGCCVLAEALEDESGRAILINRIVNF